ncbi:MAG TPA: sensor histidine kinase [Rhodanobacteraceae bacterium]
MKVASLTTWVPRWLRPAPDSMAVHMRCAGFKSWSSLFNLIWSLWVFAPALAGHMNTAYWWATGIGYAVFLLLVVLLNVRSRSEVPVYVWIMALLSFASMPFNMAGWAYGVFACAYVPWYVGKGVVQSVRYMVGIVAGMLFVAGLLGWPWQELLIMVAVSTSVAAGSLVGNINVRKNIAERLSSDEVRRLAANAERERIGRDLHDLLGHTLSLITLKLELSRKLFDVDPERSRSELTEAEKVARHALAEVRAAVTGIRATGLAGELASARLMLRTSGVELDVGPMPALPEAVDDTLAWVLRESVTNIHRHAHARHASVSVDVIDGHALMRVRDDGRGGVGASGNGLNGMRERIAAVAGSLRICSLPYEGTELCIDIPLSASSRAPVSPNVVPFPHQAGGSHS